VEQAQNKAAPKINYWNGFNLFRSSGFFPAHAYANRWAAELLVMIRDNPIWIQNFQNRGNGYDCSYLARYSKHSSM
jgi:hypothetical protein